MPGRAGEQRLPLTREERFRLLRNARYEGISPREWGRVFRLLEQLELCSGSGRCCPRMEVLAGKMHCCRDTARKRVRLAEQLGLLTTKTRNGGCAGGQTSHEYVVHWERLRGVVRPRGGPGAENSQGGAENSQAPARNQHPRPAENQCARPAENSRPVNPNNQLSSTGLAPAGLEAGAAPDELLQQWDGWAEPERLAFLREHLPAQVNQYRRRPESKALRGFVALALHKHGVPIGAPQGED